MRIPLLRWTAFTLVELMVTVTIIVVLVAILLPSVERATYEAKFAACAANLRGIAISVHTYGTDFVRWYPYRQGVTYSTADWWAWYPMKLRQDSVDERPVLSGYIQVQEQFNDPLGPAKVELGDTLAPSRYIYDSYNLFYGWQYRHVGDGSGAEEEPMFKIGQRFSWSDADGELRLNVIASDHDRRVITGTQNTSNHPDASNVLKYDVAAPGAVELYSRWANMEQRRGELDVNVAYDDGSARGARGLSVGDDREIRVPDRHDGRFLDQWWLFLPR